MGLAGKVCIVTGAAQGLGREFALTLAREGASVACVDIQATANDETARQVEQAGGHALAVTADVTDPESSEAMARQVAAKLGGIDGLVNNAAVYAGLKLRSLEEIPPDEWDRVMAANVRGVWLASRAVVPYMRRRGGGKIVNLASGVVLNGAPFLLHYVASKGAVLAMTRAMARELGPQGIAVNSVAPGLTMTQASVDLYTAEAVARNVQGRCLQREEQPGDVAGAVVFLLSAGADFITGQMLVVNGGQVFH
jgi:NAD(P)-dependent dehydrogenase (short-subunit alcohol dehydrogenase family)